MEWHTSRDERVTTDGKLNASEIDMEFVRNIEQLIWGQGFAPPSFQAEMKVIDQRVVGEKHLKLIVSIDGKKIEAMRLGSPDFLPDEISAVYRLSINEFRGNETLQLILEHTNIV